MKRHNKWFSVLLIGILVLSLYGCRDMEQSDNLNGNVTEEETEAALSTLEDIEEEVGGTITVWVADMQLANNRFMEYKRSFEAANEGTRVVYKVVTDYENAGAQYIRQGGSGDVVMLPECLSADEVKEYFIPFGTAEKIGKKYKEKYIHHKDFDGYVYGLPECIKPQGIAYNKRVLEYSGVSSLPETPTDFIRMLKKIRSRNPDVIPFYVNLDDGNLKAWQSHVWGSVSGSGDYRYGEFLADKDAFSREKPNYIVNKLLYDIVKNELAGGEAVDYLRAKTMFNRGQIACMMVGFDELSALQKAGVNPDDVGYMPFPYKADGVRYATAAYGYCYAVPKDSENKATAAAFIEYMLKESGYANSMGAVSIKKKTGKPALLKPFTGVELVTENPPTDENAELYEKRLKEMGLDLDSPELPEMTVRAALGKTGDGDYDAFMRRIADMRK